MESIVERLETIQKEWLALYEADGKISDEKLTTVSELIDEMETVSNSNAQTYSELVRRQNELKNELQKYTDKPISQELDEKIQQLNQAADNIISEYEVMGRNLDALRQFVSYWKNIGTNKNGGKAQTAGKIPSTVVERIDKLNYPVDKVNSTIWDCFANDSKGQIKFAIKAEREGSRIPLNILYSIDFSAIDKELKITKSLSPFDKRVYIAIAGLYSVGFSFVSLTQIHYAMGGTTRPGKKEMKKIRLSILKMIAAQIYINNEQEITVYQNYVRFVYFGPLLPCEVQTAYTNGQLSDGVIHIFREPPVMTFARQRKQISTIAIKVLQSPISKTDANLRIEDYLIERVCRAKKNAQQKNLKKIMWETLFEKTKITDAKQRKRTPEKVEKLLSHMVDCEMIKKYEIRCDGIAFEFDSEASAET